LARAAVSGDESALDMFSWKESGTRLSLSVPHEVIDFYVMEVYIYIYCNKI